MARARGEREQGRFENKNRGLVNQSGREGVSVKGAGFAACGPITGVDTYVSGSAVDS